MASPCRTTAGSLAAALLVGAALAGLLRAGVARADGFDSGTDAYDVARVVPIVERAHAYLAAQQRADGSFSVDRSSASRSAPVGVTAIAALSFMAAGNTPNRGAYQTQVRRAIDWLVQRCDDDGYFYFDGDSTSKMHGQGYGLLALVQAYGMYGSERERERLGDAIRRAIDLIERTQGVTGGWYYEPKRQPDHENSITVCLLQALRAARDAGFEVDVDLIRRAESYVIRSQDPEDGRFRYGLNDPHKSWELTAASLSTLHAVGDYGSEPLERGFDALQKYDPYLDGTMGGSRVNFPYYGALYAAQAYWTYHDERLFERWWPRFVAWCQEEQEPDGSFDNGVFGSVYGAAMVSLALQVPLGYLPVFQR